MKVRILFYAVVLISVSVFVKADQKKDCSSYVKDKKVESSLATASMLANARNKDGSIRQQMNLMLANAEENLSNAEKPLNLCPSDCKLANQPLVVFSSIPNKFLSNYDQQGKCEKLLEETEKKPLIYNERQFDTMQALQSWFSDFSQGKGKDGKDLYERCSGQCSPQYKNIITKHDNKYLLDASVICGQARDKKDNNYELSYSYRWTCLDK